MKASFSYNFGVYPNNSTCHYQNRKTENHVTTLHLPKRQRLLPSHTIQVIPKSRRLLCLFGVAIGVIILGRLLRPPAFTHSAGNNHTNRS